MIHNIFLVFFDILVTWESSFWSSHLLARLSCLNYCLEGFWGPVVCDFSKQRNLFAVLVISNKWKLEGVEVAGSRITVGARALSKHVPRSLSSWWGSFSGTGLYTVAFSQIWVMLGCLQIVICSVLVTITNDVCLQLVFSCQVSSMLTLPGTEILGGLLHKKSVVITVPWCLARL